MSNDREKDLGRVIDMAAYRQRNGTGVQPAFTRRGIEPFHGIPSSIMRMQIFMFDAPEEPALVKLVWLLSFFAAVPMPDGRTYRLERGVLEVQSDDKWMRSEASLNALAEWVVNLTRDGWRQLSLRCPRRKTVLRFPAQTEENQGD